ncbi:MAG: CBS domain-containing protein [Myxococcales bacterium]|nr:CBS domain-containing protein [Myxococcales bacterium]
MKGVVSQRDLYFVESLDDDVDPEEITVDEAMTEDVLAVAPSTLVADVEKEMVEQRAGSAIVIDGGKVVGIFTTMDALRALADDGA